MYTSAYIFRTRSSEPMFRSYRDDRLNIPFTDEIVMKCPSRASICCQVRSDNEWLQGDLR